MTESESGSGLHAALNVAFAIQSHVTVHLKGEENSEWGELHDFFPLQTMEHRGGSIAHVLSTCSHLSKMSLKQMNTL